MNGAGRGNRVYARSDFSQVGSRATVNRALKQLVDGGKIRKVGRGLYDLPRQNKLLKKDSPVHMDSVIKALEKRDKSRLMPDGFVAANSLGLTTAVPADISYLTDGSPRVVQIGNRLVKLKRVSSKWMYWYSRLGRDVVLALRWLGSRNVDDSVVDQLKTVLPDKVKKDLIDGIDAMPLWMASVVKKAAADVG
jgi:aryl-alcohol dehydrogenase-like predicted oxidoreductase